MTIVAIFVLFALLFFPNVGGRPPIAIDLVTVKLNTHLASQNGQISVVFYCGLNLPCNLSVVLPLSGVLAPCVWFICAPRAFFVGDRLRMISGAEAQVADSTNLLFAQMAGVHKYSRIKR